MTEPKHLVDWLRMEPRECNSDGDHHIGLQLLRYLRFTIIYLASTTDVSGYDAEVYSS
jgi:hypothetical protein